MSGQDPGPDRGPQVVSQPPHVPDHELLGIIGRGAYGEVWLARNAVGTLRAVKVVHRQTFERDEHFEREFKGLQQFEPVSRMHEGLMDILHLGRHDEAGYFYYVMELADDANAELGARNAELIPAGQATVPRSAFHAPSSYTPHTLRHQLRTPGPMSVDRVLELGLKLASALDHLHQRGLVHRDVKPSNIIFVNGEPKLADAGLVARMDDAQSLVGTAGYIAPEGPGKVQGDLYSLGKVLYEAAFGKDRQEFPQLPADLAARPDQARLLELNEIILKACAHDPQERYRSAEDLHRDLERLQRGRSIRRRRMLEAAGRRIRRLVPGVGALLLVAVAMTLWWRQPTTGPPVNTAEQTIFVLPFRHAAPMAEPSFTRIGEQNLCVCGRMTDAFIDALPLIPGIRTGPRKSDWIRHNEDEVRRALVRTNDTRYVVTGRVDHTNDVLRLALRLYPREHDEPLWTESLAGATNEIPALEKRAIAAIAQQLGRVISDVTRQQLDQVLSNNWAAYGLFVQGWAHHVSGTKPGSFRALECFNRALELDPKYLTAHEGYMRVRRELIIDQSPAQGWPDMADRARRILKIDDTSFAAECRLADKLLAYDYDWDGGIAAKERQMEIWPDKNLTWMFFFRQVGRTNEARVYHERLKREPELDLFEMQHLVMGELLWRNHDEAMSIANRMIELAPDMPFFGHYHLGRCLLVLGRYAEAIEAFQKCAGVWESSDLDGILGRAYALMGDRKTALELLRRLEDRLRMGEGDPYFLAWIHGALGDKAQALAYLNQAIDYHSEYITNPDYGGLRTDPAWDDLRDDPRFDALCRRVWMGKGQWPK